MAKLVNILRKHHPRQLNIQTKEHLALRLGVDLATLEGVARYLPLHYNPTRVREKKDGKSFREIDAPRYLLKTIQRKIHVKLLAPLWLPDVIHGYRSNRSIVTAMRPHAGRLFMWLADIRQFYPSISSDRIYRMFCALGCSPDVARLLTILTTRDHHLPQGAPTSPALANLHLRLSGVARRLIGLSKTHGLTLTFFGDDVIVSRDIPFKGLRYQLEEIITSSGLRLNPKKTTAVLGPDVKHSALGLITNSDGCAVNVSRGYRRTLRSAIYLYRRFGPTSLLDRGFTSKDPKRFLIGKIAFAIQVNPENRDLLDQLNPGEQAHASVDVS
jgi:RNA-directed DNA polymerase